MRKRLVIKFATQQDNYIYALSDGIPVIFVIDRVSDVIVDCFVCPEEANIEGEVFSGLLVYENSLILVPQNAKDVWIFHLVDKKWHKVDISKYINRDSRNKFRGGCIKSGILYMFGYSYRGIIAIDINDNKMWELAQNKTNLGGLLGLSIVELNDKVYLPVRSMNGIICIDTRSSMLEIRKTDVHSEIANDGLAYDGRHYYLLKNSGNELIVLNEEFSLEYRLKLDAFFNSKINYFEGIVYFSGKLILFGSNKYGYIYDLQNENESYVINESLYYAKALTGSELLVCKKGKIEIWNTNLEVIKEYVLEINETDIVKVLGQFRLKEQMIYENDLFGVEDLLRSVCCDF